MPDHVATTATFLDAEHEAQLTELGYVVLDGLVDADRLQALREISERVYVDERSGFHASNLSRHHGYRHAVNEQVTPVLAPAVQHLFTGHEPFFSSLVIKWPGEGSSFPSHQDWNMVDETRHRSINVFCPLVDATAGNGALRVLPRSHRVLRQLRVSPMPPSGCESAGWQVTPDEMDVVELRAGQVLVFDHALLHCSAPNLSEDPRWAVITAFKPRGAELFHWYVPDPSSNRVEVFGVDSAFFADIDIGDRPAGTPLREEEYVGDPLSKRDLLERCGRAVDGDVAAGSPAVAANPYAPVDDTPATPARTLRDPALEAQLDDRGWVVVDLLDADEVRRLREAYDSLPHVISEGRSFARGFYASMIDDRPGYRRDSDAAIRAVLEEPAGRVLDGMVWAFSNWVTKEPGAAAAPHHVDWTFVDEDRHRSVSIWAPLVDTDERTGCIGVVDGSHHAVRFVRAATSPTYQETDGWGRSLPGSHPVPLRPGQAVVFDHRLVHFSAEHHGGQRRIAVTCEFVPAGAELLHLEWLDGDRFLRHVVSPEFYVTYAAGSDPTAVPGHLAVAEVTGPTFRDEVGTLATAPGPATDAGLAGIGPAPATDAGDEPLTARDRLRAAVARPIPRRWRRAVRATLPGR